MTIVILLMDFRFKMAYNEVVLMKSKSVVSKMYQNLKPIVK